MENQESGENPTTTKDTSATKTKRVTPGRTAKATKRKLSDSKEKTPRAVKQKVDPRADNMALTLEQLRSELGAQDKRIKDNIEKSVNALSSRIDQNADMIRKERDERRNDMKNMQTQLDRVASGGTNRPGQATRFISRNDDRYNKYQRSRRSLILYPIKGENLDAMLADLQRYCSKALQIPSGDIQRNQIELVRRFRGTKTARDRKEVIVLFTDNETRDYVQSHARNLAGMSDHGVRIDVPSHLMNVKRALDKYGFILKGELGVGFKRNVKFEDSEETLIMDVCYPGEEKWERITYEMAVEGIKQENTSPVEVDDPMPPSTPQTQAQGVPTNNMGEDLDEQGNKEPVDNVWRA